MRRVHSALLAVVVILLGTACSFTEDSSGTGDGLLRIAMRITPDAGLAIETDDASVLTLVGAVEPLVKTSPDAEIIPGLAESWERLGDRTWRFTIRDDVQFHDGTPLDATAVVGALEYVLNSATPPRGFENSTVSPTAVDARTVEFTTEAPDPILPQRLSAPSLSVLAPAAYADGGVPDVFGTGTGPFVLTNESPGQSVTVERFDDYWGGRAALAGAEVRFVPDPATRAAALRAGDVHLADDLPISQVPILEAEPGITLDVTDLPRTTVMYINNTAGPLADPRVREALRLAIDREALAANVLEGSSEPAVGVFGPAVPWFQDLEGEHDPARARTLLETAGVGNLSVDLWTYSERAELPVQVTAIQGMLAEVGVTADITVSEASVLGDRALAGEHDLYVLSRGYLAGSADPGVFLESDYGCEGSFNYDRYCTPEMSALIGQLASTDTTAERHALFQQAEEMLVADVVDVPLTHDQGRTAFVDAVEGFEAYPLGGYLLTTTLALAR